MISSKPFTAICLVAALCTAQTINISGVVQDCNGVGIVGATVKLEKANLSAVSGAGGVFTLTGSAISATPRSSLGAIVTTPVQFLNGKISLVLSGNTSVNITIHDVGGRQVFGCIRTLSSGAHIISVPKQTAGIFLYNVTIGNITYSFNTLSLGVSSMQQSLVSIGASALSRQEKAMAEINDVIAATSPGMLNYRCAIWQSDTSGFVIRMIANAGDVTDVDGNVYQSVRIGEQVWTTENLRVTRYNDSSAITLHTLSGTWRNGTVGKYCFYQNSTDPEYQKKWGALYNWYAVNTGKLSPAGWHVPTDSEWTVMDKYLVLHGYNYDGSTDTSLHNRIAKALAAKADWPASSIEGSVGNHLTINNSSGFSALGSGYRYLDGNFYTKSESGRWWSSTGGNATNASSYGLRYDADHLLSSYFDQSCGFSVRLLRN